jgi:hypothetical protein
MSDKIQVVFTNNLSIVYKKGKYFVNEAIVHCVGVEANIKNFIGINKKPQIIIYFSTPVKIVYPKGNDKIVSELIVNSFVINDCYEEI